MEENKNKIDLNELIICPTCKAVNKGERHCHNCHTDLALVSSMEFVEENTTKKTKHNNEINRGKIDYKKNKVHLLDIILLLISLLLLMGVIIYCIIYGIQIYSFINSCTNAGGVWS